MMIVCDFSPLPVRLLFLPQSRHCRYHSDGAGPLTLHCRYHSDEGQTFLIIFQKEKRNKNKKIPETIE